MKLEAFLAKRLVKLWLSSGVLELRSCSCLPSQDLSSLTNLRFIDPLLDCTYKLISLPTDDKTSKTCIVTSTNAVVFVRLCYHIA